jgi:hypothetical protein
MGSFEVGTDEIIIFGGLNEGPNDRILNFKIHHGSAEGEIFTSTQKLPERDFFVTNGV